MSDIEKLQVFQNECERIQAVCACRSNDAGECAQDRDDLDPDDEAHARLCECACHSEIAEVEEELWP